MSEEEILKNTLGNQHWWVNRTLNDIKVLLGGQADTTRTATDTLKGAALTSENNDKKRNKATSLLVGTLIGQTHNLEHNLQQLGQAAWNSQAGFDKMLGPLIGLGGLLGFVAQGFAETVEIYRKSVAMGETFNGSIAQMSKAAHDAGLTIEQMASMMHNNSAVLSAFGPEQLAKMTGATRELMHQFAMFGMSVEEVDTWFGQYLESQRVLGLSERLGADEAAKSFAKLVETTTALARITGRQRDEILRDMMKESKAADLFLASVQVSKELGEEAARTMTQTAGAVAELPGIGKTFREMMLHAALNQSPLEADGSAELQQRLGDGVVDLAQKAGKGMLSEAKVLAELQRLAKDVGDDHLQTMARTVTAGNAHDRAIAEYIASVQNMPSTDEAVASILKKLNDVDNVANGVLTAESRFGMGVQKTKAELDNWFIAIEAVVNGGADALKGLFDKVWEMEPAKRMDKLFELLPAVAMKLGDEAGEAFKKALPPDAFKGIIEMGQDTGKFLMETMPDFAEEYSAATGKSVEWLRENIGDLTVAAGLAAAVGGTLGLQKLKEDRAAGKVMDKKDVAEIAQKAAAATGLSNQNQQNQQPANAAMGGGLPAAMQDLAVAANQLSQSASNMNSTMSKMVIGAGLFAAVETALEVFKAANNPMAGLVEAVNGLNASVGRLETSTGNDDLLMSVGILNTTMGTLNQSVGTMSGLTTVGDNFNAASLRMETTMNQLEAAFRQVAANTQATTVGIAETNTRLQRLGDVMDQVKSSIKVVADSVS